MHKEFKRSIKGYDPESVQREITNLKHEFDKEIEWMESELKCVIGDNEILKYNILLIEDKIDMQKQFEEKIAKDLLMTHIQISKRVYDFKENVKQNVKNKLKIVQTDESIKYNFKNNLTKIVKELQKILEE